ncbi:MAG: enoyl-CoA hydratase/isomerase family protein [Rickettsiales bacterium]|jgi:2-(1,2-epoxy-1,2-dihydrophenyl)acetyl-CoA isomerase
MSETTLEVEDGVAVFTLNRPEKMNAISQGMFEKDLPEMVARATEDDDIRVLILAGAGGNFCSGADVSRMGGDDKPTPEDRDRKLRGILDYLYKLINLPKPVISAVDGIAFGGGFSLAVTADIVLATPRAKFSLVFGRIGLIPDMTAAYVLPRLIGPRRTKELTFTARAFGVEEAMAMGIVQETHAPEALLPAAKRMAAQLSQGSATAMAEAKRLIDMSLQSSQAEMIDAECAAQLACRGTEFHGEAVRRFLTKEPRLYDWDAMQRKQAAE